MTHNNLRSYALSSQAWPFEEARKILTRIEEEKKPKEKVLFETGYGPSGLPHIGTFGEVVRTTMVRHAFSLMSDIPTELYAVSDDMDGLRKVPDNIPNKEMVREHLGKPLTQIPDPFGTHESFGHHNNARLRAFLDSFGFNYTFISSSECYKAGRYDAMLLKVLEHYDDVINVILPTLGQERQATYSPFLPICPKTGHVLQVPILERNIDAGTVVYKNDEGKLIEVSIFGGHCKLQWKADWGMRWAAFGVDYEMSGKDLIDSVKLSSRVCKVLGYRPPEGFNYELFLDADGTKISKSKGNGLTIDEWLAYAPEESLAYFMYQAPRKAKRLYFDVIPRQVDEYLNAMEKYADQTQEQQLVNPLWHIHQGTPLQENVPLSFGMLLNLVGVCNTDDKNVLWGFITRYAPQANPKQNVFLDKLVGYAIRYYQDFIKPHKKFRAPTEQERKALVELKNTLKSMSSDADALQTEIYEIGKKHGFSNLRDWFQGLYETLLGQTEGPRMGSFIALYGIEETVKLIDQALNQE